MVSAVVISAVAAAAATAAVLGYRWYHIAPAVLTYVGEPFAVDGKTHIPISGRIVGGWGAMMFDLGSEPATAHLLNDWQELLESTLARPETYAVVQGGKVCMKISAKGVWFETGPILTRPGSFSLSILISRKECQPFFDALIENIVHIIRLEDN